jgi:hypothetical protein
MLDLSGLSAPKIHFKSWIRDEAAFRATIRIDHPAQLGEKLRKHLNLIFPGKSVEGLLGPTSIRGTARFTPLVAYSASYVKRAAELSVNFSFINMSPTAFTEQPTPSLAEADEKISNAEMVFPFPPMARELPVLTTSFG